MSVKPYWPMLDTINAGASDIWRPFSRGYTAPIGYLLVTPNQEKVRIPFEYKLVEWDGETLTEECGKMYSWHHNPYLTWKLIE